MPGVAFQLKKGMRVGRCVQEPHHHGDILPAVHGGNGVEVERLEGVKVTSPPHEVVTLEGLLAGVLHEQMSDNEAICLGRL